MIDLSKDRVKVRVALEVPVLQEYTRVKSRRGCGDNREIKEEWERGSGRAPGGTRMATSAERMVGNCGTRPEG
jgi:hypothetical protein